MWIRFVWDMKTSLGLERTSGLPLRRFLTRRSDPVDNETSTINDSNRQFHSRYYYRGVDSLHFDCFDFEQIRLFLVVLGLLLGFGQSALV